MDSSHIVNSLVLMLATLAMLFEKTCIAAPVFRGPRVQNKEPGEWAEFECSVSCSHSIDWYVEGYTGHITNSCSETKDGMMVCKEVTQTCSSASSTTGYKETLKVLAKTELASSSIAVQCAAISLTLPTGKDCQPFLSYSRYALLSVRSLPTTPPPPSPTPVVCPTATVQDVTTTVHVTDTSTVTAIKEHTVTQTVTHTVMVEATPEPKSDYGSGSGIPNFIQPEDI